MAVKKSSVSSSSSSDVATKDEDERLLREVDAEMARGLLNRPTSLSLSQQTAGTGATAMMAPEQLLSVVQEREEAEAMAPRLEEAEETLEEVGSKGMGIRTLL